MIQLITFETEKTKKIFSNIANVKIVSFSEYESFDMFDINIINLSSKDIWECDSASISYLNMKSHLNPLKKSIKTCKAKVIIVLPMNIYFSYSKRYDGRFGNHVYIKDILDVVLRFLNSYIEEKIPAFAYEKCETTISDYKYKSDFYFENVTEGVKYSSDKSNKVNTIHFDNVFITTLNILDISDNEKCYDKFYNFINDSLGIISEKTPIWFDDIKFFNDQFFIDRIESSNKKIDDLKIKIEDDIKKLEKNKRIKSILYETGSRLNDIVVDIIEDILKKHNDFKDKFEEDYKFEYNNTTFLVETKGLNNEVAGKNVNDAIAHMTIYEDQLEQEGKEEKTKCLFIVTSEREKTLEERMPIKERQITIAKRNNTLIIDTPTLLKIYEDYLEKKITREEIIMIFNEQVGLISYNKR